MPNWRKLLPQVYPFLIDWLFQTMRLYLLLVWYLFSWQSADCNTVSLRSTVRRHDAGPVHERWPVAHPKLAKRMQPPEDAASQNAPLGPTHDGQLHDPRGHPEVTEGRITRARRPDTELATHVGMYQVRWIPMRAHAEHEAVVTELMTCTALIIHVGGRGAVAAHLSPLASWYRREVGEAIALARQHHREGDRYEVHACQPDPTRFDPGNTNIYGGNRLMREFLVEAVQGALRNPPQGRPARVNWHYYHMKTRRSRGGEYPHAYRNNFHAKLHKAEDAVKHDTRLSRYADHHVFF